MTDVVLDKAHANSAAEILVRDGVSVADAHVGAAVTLSGWEDVTVLTSDPGDMLRVCAPVSIAAILV